MQRAADRALVIPPITQGFSPHHMDFPGAITIGVESFIRHGVDVCSSLACHGFTRILIVNGHGSIRPLRYHRALEDGDAAPMGYVKRMERRWVGTGQSGKFDVALENWANGTDPDDSILLRCDMAPPAGRNIYHFCDRRLDAAASQALNRYDIPGRKALYGTIQRIVASQLPIIVLWYQRQLDAVITDLRNYKPAHAVTPFWNTWEWRI